MSPVDRIIVENSPTQASRLLIIDAPQLVGEASTRAGQVVVWCDDIRDAATVPAEFRLDQLDAAALAGVDLVWLRLPRALGALAEYAELIAAHAANDVLVVAGGREKDLNRSMNTTLAKHFTDIRASLGRQKSRALLAQSPIPGPISWPRHRLIEIAGRPIDLWWHGATFAAGRIDAGTRLLVEHLGRLASAERYLDLGCGSGLLATLIASQHPDAEVSAIDVSWAATDVTRRTSAGTGVQTHWAADLAVFDQASLDVIVCNPPFHQGAAKESSPTLAMFTEAARTLSAGGEFWCVFNSHLPWRARLAQLIGPTKVIAQNRQYTVTRSQR